MIEISYEKPAQRRIVDVLPFAWFGWPLDVLERVGREIKYAFLKSANVRHLRFTLHHYKGGLYRYEGDELKCVRTIESFLPPVTRYMEFETDADFRRYRDEHAGHMQSL